MDTLKLARESHHGVPEDRRSSAVVRALVALGKDLGLRVVAEGIDRHEQLGFLRRSGCDAVQALMSCPPLPADACTGWLRQASARREGLRALAAPGPFAAESRYVGPPVLRSAHAR
jgi:diguanylate cyclase